MRRPQRLILERLRNIHEFLLLVRRQALEHILIVKVCQGCTFGKGKEPEGESHSFHKSLNRSLLDVNMPVSSYYASYPI